MPEGCAWVEKLIAKLSVTIKSPLILEIPHSLAFTGDRLQWAASYHLSVFTNDVTAVTVQNPYNRALGGNWPGGALVAFPNGFGEYGLAPSSIAHQALLSGAYAVSGIPAAALVKDGKVIWRGHPSRLTDELVQQLLSS